MTRESADTGPGPRWPEILPPELADRPIADFVAEFCTIGRAFVGYQRDPGPTPVEALEWEIEQEFVRLCQETFDKVTIVAEEHMNRFGRVISGSGPLSVTLDPLDGSASYAAGSSRYACTVAVRKDSIPLFGLVYLPATEDVYVGVAGGGAYRGAHRLPKLPKLPERRRSPVIAVKSQISGVPEVTAITHRLRAAGYRTENVESTSLKLCWTAEGARAGVIKTLRANGGLLFDWGTAAGLLICRETGLLARTWTGKPWCGAPGGLMVGDRALIDHACPGVDGAPPGG